MCGFLEVIVSPQLAYRKLVELMDEVVAFAQAACEDVSMRDDTQSSQEAQQEEVLEFQIESYRLRQFLAREIVKKFGFNRFKVDFNKNSEAFVVWRPPKGAKCFKPIFTGHPTSSQKADNASRLNAELIGLQDFEIGFSRVIEEIINF